MELLHSLQKNKACYGRQVFAFNLPAPGTCKPTRWCAANCYAQSTRLNKLHRKERYEISLSKEFPDLVIGEIKKKKIKLVRIHSTGDFYSRNYVKKWMKIAENCPDTVFRTSTRRRDLTRDILKLNVFKNLVARESLDPSRVRPSMNLSIAAVEGTPMTEKFFRCRVDCQECGYYCWYHKTNISLPIFYNKRDENFLIP